MQDSNDDERIRDHLANERTFLAWLRTGMAMMGFGVVIDPQESLNPFSRMPADQQKAVIRF